MSQTVAERQQAFDAGVAASRAADYTDAIEGAIAVFGRIVAVEHSNTEILGLARAGSLMLRAMLGEKV